MRINLKDLHRTDVVVADDDDAAATPTAANLINNRALGVYAVCTRDRHVNIRIVDGAGNGVWRVTGANVECARGKDLIVLQSHKR